MCTATWYQPEETGYELFFNRDERKTRQPALPPSFHILNGVTYLAPADGTYGGTWIGVNEAGVSLCLLNHHGAKVAREREGMTSRGILIGAMLDVQRLSDMAGRVGRASLADFNPFVLLGFAPGAQPVSYTWDGKSVVMKELTREDMPVTTSSHSPSRVARRRRKTLRSFAEEDGSTTPDLLEQYHRSTMEKDRAFGVCMSRPDAHTVSFSHIQVEPERVFFHYYRVLAEEKRFMGPVTLELARLPDRIPVHIRSASKL